VERDRREEHDEGRRAREQAGGDADAQDALRRQRAVVVMVVMLVTVVLMMVVVLMCVTVDSAPAQPLPEHRCPDDHDEQPGRERQPGVQPLGDDELREAESDETEGEHAGRVSQGDGAAQKA